MQILFYSIPSHPPWPAIRKEKLKGLATEDLALSYSNMKSQIPSTKFSGFRCQVSGVRKRNTKAET
jgi:hypothetical protein